MGWFGRRRRRTEDEAFEHHPVDAQGRPDLSTFRRPAEAYARLHLEGISTFDFAKRVEGQWGLIAKVPDQCWCDRALPDARFGCVPPDRR